MLSVKIEKRTIEFKNSFDEITIEDFAINIDFENKIEKVLKEIEAFRKDRDDFRKVADDAKSEEEPNEADLQIEHLNELIIEATFRCQMFRISQISFLTDNPKRTENFLLETKGITAKILSDIYKKIQEGFGDFLKYFKNLKEVKSFRFRDFERHGFFKLKNCIFEVKDLSKQTVIRDAGATIVAQKIGTFRNQFESNNWRNFARFVAYVARPAKEDFEYFPRKKWSSFIGGKKFEQMSAADRLSVYNAKLKEAVEERTKIFNQLPISVAIGVYKYYFQLKKNFQKLSKVFTTKVQKRQSKQSHI